MERTELDQILETVRRFTRERLVPSESDVDETGCIPDSLVGEMRDLGLFGLNVPEIYGGLGLSASEEMEVMVELTWAAAAFRSLISMNIGAGVQGLINEGTDAQKAQWLPRIASGEIIAAFALTEPGSGSDAGALKTTADRCESGFVLNGTKQWVTNAARAGLFTVMARTERERLPKNAHISAFLVPADTPGLRVGPEIAKMGQSGSSLADIYLEDVLVGEDAVIGGTPGRGLGTAMRAVNRNRLNIAAVCVGQARRVLDEMLKYSQEREQFGKPVSEFQLIQAMLADSYVELSAAEALLDRTARAYDAGTSTARDTSGAKMYASEMVGRLADRAVQIYGGSGYMRESIVERLYRDVRVFRIYGGTTQVQQTVIARDLLRTSAQ